MKNVVIIKNLPSNLVEQAIVVIKDKNKVKAKENMIKGYMKEEELEKIKEIRKDNRKYVIQEAEMVIKDYFERIEQNNNYITKKKLEKRYRRMKYANFVLMSILLLDGVLKILLWIKLDVLEYRLLSYFSSLFFMEVGSWKLEVGGMKKE